MRHVFVFPIALTASSALLAADPLPHGGSAVISGISCKTLDLEPNDGIAPYARLIGTPNSIGPYSVVGSLESTTSQNRVLKSRLGSGFDSLYMTLDSQGSSGTAVVAPSGNNSAGLLSASSATAPGRVYDSYGFVAAYYPQFRLGPNSAVECKGSYVITAWAKTAADAPDSAFSSASVAAVDLPNGDEAVTYHAEAAGNPINGKRYSQKTGQISFRLNNYDSRERIVQGAFQAFVNGGRP